MKNLFSNIANAIKNSRNSKKVYAMRNFKNILIFDAFPGRLYAGHFLMAIPAEISFAKISYGSIVAEGVSSKIWKDHWQFYMTREPFKYAPEDIHLTNKLNIAGCLQIIDLGLYTYLLNKDRESLLDENILHEEMSNIHYNCIAWAKRYGLVSAVVMLEDNRPATEDDVRKMKSVYGLSDHDLLLQASLTQSDTILAALAEITQYFENRL